MSVPNTPLTQPPADPTISTGAALTGIFFEPGRVFESLRVRPHFLVATIICIVFFGAFQLAYFQKVGYERVVKEDVENGPRSDQKTPEQKETEIRIRSGPIGKALGAVFTPIIFGVIFAAGAGLYLLGSLLMAKPISYKQALAVWAYSAMPPTVLAMIINVILVFLKPIDYDIVMAARRGLVRANLSFLSDPKAAPILYTCLGSLDVFGFYALFLGAVGLRKVGKMSSGSAWGIVLSIWIIVLVLKVGLAAAFGQGF